MHEHQERLSNAMQTWLSQQASIWEGQSTKIAEQNAANAETRAILQHYKVEILMLDQFNKSVDRAKRKHGHMHTTHCLM